MSNGNCWSEIECWFSLFSQTVQLVKEAEAVDRAWHEYNPNWESLWAAWWTQYVEMERIMQGHVFQFNPGFRLARIASPPGNNSPWVLALVPLDTPDLPNGLAAISFEVFPKRESYSSDFLCLHYPLPVPAQLNYSDSVPVHFGLPGDPQGQQDEDVPKIKIEPISKIEPLNLDPKFEIEPMMKTEPKFEIESLMKTEPKLEIEPLIMCTKVRVQSLSELQSFKVEDDNDNYSN